MKKITKAQFINEADELYTKNVENPTKANLHKQKLISLIFEYYKDFNFVWKYEIKGEDSNTNESIATDMILQIMKEKQLDKWISYYTAHNNEYEDSHFGALLFHNIKKYENWAVFNYIQEKSDKKKNLEREINKLKKAEKELRGYKGYKDNGSIPEQEIADHLGKTVEQVRELKKLSQLNSTYDDTLNENDTDVYSSEKKWDLVVRLNQFLKKISLIWEQEKKNKMLISLILTYRLYDNVSKTDFDITQVINDKSIISMDFWNELNSPLGKEYDSEKSVFQKKLCIKYDGNYMKRFKGKVYEKYKDDDDFEYGLLTDELPNEIKKKYGLS